MNSTRRKLAVFSGFLILLAPVSSPGDELPPLIPREVLFGNPDKIEPRISPDGKRLGYIAPDAGVLNVWVKTIGKSDDRPVTEDRDRGIRWFFWAENNQQIVYDQDKGGDENWRLYSVNVDTVEEQDLTPFERTQAFLLAVERDYPNELLIYLNQRNPELYDVHRVDLTTGKLTLEVENTERFSDWRADHEMRVRAALKHTDDGGLALWVRDNADSPWRSLATFGIEDSLTTWLEAFTADNRGLYLVSSVGSNTSQLRRMDLTTGEERVLAFDEQADVDSVLMHPGKHTVQAVRFNKHRQIWKVLDPAVEADFAAIGRIRDADFTILNRDHDDRTWLVGFTEDDGPIHYYSFDRESKKAILLFTNRRELENLKLAQMQPIQFSASDGLDIHGYLTLPVGVEPKNLPTVLLVHGGPFWRDSWGYNPLVQWLANRGYAVLQVNFRGSTGYGKNFVNAANREWGGKMHQDLIDGVNWITEKGVADPERIAIFGGSYGGYATLVGLTFTPEVFACGVDIVGPSNLITFMETIPPYWKPWESVWFTRVGDPKKERDFLMSRSPISKVDQVTKPLVIAQGANDPRVKKSESLQMVEAMRKAGKDVEYIEYADEGHGFAKPENRLHFFAHAEKFLEKHLGGRYEP